MNFNDMVCSNQHEYESNPNGDQTKEMDGWMKNPHGKDEFLLRCIENIVESKSGHSSQSSLSLSFNYGG
ncbi:hypothetical protein Avbf_16830 [Armadillidium vulgare]|nr:hypothetical protein Avbf_16830 [Armadillidium vulgare]